jgi:chromosome segregation ATPase
LLIKGRLSLVIYYLSIVGQETPPDVKQAAMTQGNENGSRLDRIEALMMELATASVRHDNEFSRINQTLDRVAEQQEANRQAISQLTAEQHLSRQDINTLTASIQELRNLVADYIQSRSEQ